MAAPNHPKRNLSGMAALPNDITETILVRLPIKSLIRFKSVSRSWNTMISDPRFIRTHYQLSMNSDNLFDFDSDNLFVGRSDAWFSLVRLEGQELKTEVFARKPNGWVAGFGDGLVLLGCGNDCNRKYLLWNPCTRQETILPLPNCINTNFSVYGLCHDPRNHDFKVVIAFKNFYTVFSFKVGSWAEKKEIFNARTKIAHQTWKWEWEWKGGLSVDGAIYRVWYKKHENTYRLLCFDAGDDKFKILQKPENLKDDKPLYLSSLKGRLYLYCNGEDDMRAVKIWIKEKGWNSWKVLVNIENFPEQLVPLFGFGVELAPLTENEIILGFSGRTTCFIYNCSDKSYQEFETSYSTWRFPFRCTMLCPVLD